MLKDNILVLVFTLITEVTYPTGPAVGLTGAGTPCKHNHMSVISSS